MSFINQNFGEIKIDKQLNMDLHQAAQNQSDTQDNVGATSRVSPVHLSTVRGKRIDFIRVINTLYELGFFTDDKGGEISKKNVMKTLGNAVGIDLSNYDNDLSSSLSDATNLEKHLAIFESMKDKMEEVFNSYGSIKNGHKQKCKGHK